MKHLSLLLIIFMSVSGSAFAHPAQPRPQPDVFQEGDVVFRFLNLIDDSSTGVDVYRNDNVSFFGIAPQAVSAERTISPGDHTFEIYPQNSNPIQTDPLATFTFTAESGTEAVIVTWVQNGQITMVSHLLDLSPVLVNRTRIELLNLSEAAPSVTVTAQNNDILFENTPTGEATSADVPSGNYQLSLTDDAGEVVSSTTLNASPGELETVFLFGESHLQTLSLTRQLEQESLLRFVHAERVAPPVDVYLNGELTFFTISYTGWADYVVLEPGDYTIDIYPAGSDPSADTPLISDNLQLGITAPITAVLLGERNPRLIFNQDNHQLIGANQARVRFINAALDLLALEVDTEGGEKMIAALEYVLASRNRDIDSGTRTMIFGEVGGASLTTLPDFEFAPNHYYTFVVIGNGLVSGSVEVLALDWDWRH